MATYITTATTLTTLRACPQMGPPLFTGTPFGISVPGQSVKAFVRCRVGFPTRSSRAVSFVSSSVLALLAVNKKTGLVILSGHNFTSITPVWEGGPIFEHEVFLPYAGSEVEAEWKSGFAEKLASKVDSVFFPADPLKNLAHLAFSAVMACDEAKRTELFACVLLAGGNMFSLETRFRRELAEVAKDSPHHPEIVIPEDRMTAVVFGARQFCSYSGVRDLFSAEYTPQKRRWGNVYPCY